MAQQLKFCFCIGAMAVLAGWAVAADEPSQQEAAATEAGPAQPPEEKLRLEFNGQQWLPALQWFAEKSGLNLDWQTLPEGELNLSAQTPYTLAEVRDVLNMQLLVRGFTLLQRGDVLRVVPLENLDPTLIERVQPEELESLSPHQFVRVSFPLEWMIADDAAQELKPLLSPYGKLIPLSATNQLEAMDAVVNLREIERLLAREQSDAGKQRLVEEFRLEHRRASDIAEMLRDLLGLSDSRYRRPSERDRMQLDLERTKLQSQAVKELGNNATRFLKEESDVNLVVNEEENSILVHAPPDKVEVIRQAVQSLDRPSSKTDSAWENINRVKVYKVNNVDVESIEDMVREMQSLGRLDPETRIQIDERNDTVIAYATPTDHMTLAHLVRTFQQEPREAHVVQLRMLDPRYAAQAVKVLFNNNEDSNSYYYRRYGNSEDDAFRVEADQQHSRLLIWATAEEYQRVTAYLGELGEQPAAAGDARLGMQVLQAGEVDFSEIESKLRDVWASISEAPLVIQTPPTPTSAKGASQQTQQPESSVDEQNNTQRRAARPHENTTSDVEVRTASLLQVAGQDTEVCATDDDSDRKGLEADGREKLVQLVALGQPADDTDDESAEESQSDEPSTADTPPVRVIAGPDGKLIVVSDDPVAAQLMTQLLESLLPEKSDIHVFQLKYASALSVEFQLQDLLNLNTSYSSYSSYSRNNREEQDALSVSQPNTIVYSDGRTNRLFVRHADAEQLRLIEDLIEKLDQPEEVEDDLARKQWLYQVQYKDAFELSETVKEVYRDLLSSSDRAFERGGNGERQSRIQGYWGFASSRSTVPEYQGLLSVGVDPASNSLVISAPQYLMVEVQELVKSLDQQSSAQAISVMRLESGVSSNLVKETLDQVLSEARGGRDSRGGYRRGYGR